MAILDHAEGARQQRMNDAYSELLKFLDTKKGQKMFPNWSELLDYIDERHNELNKANKKIEEYQIFFNTLSNFLPRSSSTSRKLF